MRKRYVQALDLSPGFSDCRRGVHARILHEDIITASNSGATGESLYKNKYSLNS